MHITESWSIMNTMTKASVAVAGLLAGAVLVAPAADGARVTRSVTSDACVQQTLGALQMHYSDLHRRWHQAVTAGETSVAEAADKALKLDIQRLADC